MQYIFPHALRFLISMSFTDPWHYKPAHFKRKMDWDDWEKNYIQWSRNFNSPLQQYLTSLFVCAVEN